MQTQFHKMLSRQIKARFYVVGDGPVIARYLRQCACLMLAGSVWACTSKAGLSLDALHLPLAQIPHAQRLEIKSEFRASDDQSLEPPLHIQALRNQNIAETGYFKYHLGPDIKGTYKVKLTIFTGASSRRDAWVRKYPVAVLAATETRDWGEQGFVIPGRLGAFTLGRLNLEVEALGQASELETVMRTFAKKAANLKH
jgi:hypothetical protein